MYYGMQRIDRIGPQKCAAKYGRLVMIVALHGFDWGIYAERIMPAFAHWLIHEDETTIYQLYRETRHAQEEQFVPKIMRGLRCWPRAQELVHTLPRGQFARLEYQKLCTAEAFTADRKSVV